MSICSQTLAQAIVNSGAQNKGYHFTTWSSRRPARHSPSTHAKTVTGGRQQISQLRLLQRSSLILAHGELSHCIQGQARPGKMLVCWNTTPRLHCTRGRQRPRTWVLAWPTAQGDAQEYGRRNLVCEGRDQGSQVLGVHYASRVVGVDLYRRTKMLVLTVCSSTQSTSFIIPALSSLTSPPSHPKQIYLTATHPQLYKPHLHANVQRHLLCPTLHHTPSASPTHTRLILSPGQATAISAIMAVGVVGATIIIATALAICAVDAVGLGCAVRAVWAVAAARTIYTSLVHYSLHCSTQVIVRQVSV